MIYDMTCIEYDLFILETLIQDYKLEVYVNESILIASEYPAIDQFKIIHEAVFSKLKEGFARLLQSIATLWKKFIQTMDSLISADIKYLEKYKDIILKKPLVEDDYMMFPYWEGYNEMSNFKVPAFNYNSLKDSLSSKDEFISKHFNPYNKDGLAINDVARQKFRGGVDKEQKIPSSKINLSQMYDYCIGFNSLKKRLEADMKEVEKAGNSAIDIIDKTKPDNTTNETAIYSFVKEEVIYEALPQKVSNIEKKTGSADDSSIDGERGNNDDIKVDAQNKNTEINNIKTYIEVCYGVLGVKMSVAQECYKSYMFILKDHVKVNTGETGSTKASKETSKEEPKKNDSKTELKKGWLNTMKEKIQNKKKTDTR